MLMSQRSRRIVGGLGLVAALGLLAWGGAVWAVCGRSAGRVFGRDELSSVPVQRAAVVLGCVKALGLPAELALGVVLVGACPGNTQGVAKLVVGRKVEDVIALLKGIRCRNGTSCPDQLARAQESGIK